MINKYLFATIASLLLAASPCTAEILVYDNATGEIVACFHTLPEGGIASDTRFSTIESNTFSSEDIAIYRIKDGRILHKPQLVLGGDSRPLSQGEMRSLTVSARCNDDTSFEIDTRTISVSIRPLIPNYSGMPDQPVAFPIFGSVVMNNGSAMIAIQAGARHGMGILLLEAPGCRPATLVIEVDN